jgi:hypothetical protein
MSSEEKPTGATGEPLPRLPVPSPRLHLDDLDLDAPRQGQWYFRPVDGHTAALCDRAWSDGRCIAEGGETDHGTWYRTYYRRGVWVQTRHRAEHAVVAQQFEVACVGNTGQVQRTYRDPGIPRLFVRGTITAPDYADLELGDWHEVVGKRLVPRVAGLVADVG